MRQFLYYILRDTIKFGSICLTIERTFWICLLNHLPYEIYGFSLIKYFILRRSIHWMSEMRRYGNLDISSCKVRITIIKTKIFPFDIDISWYYNIDICNWCRPYINNCHKLISYLVLVWHKILHKRECIWRKSDSGSRYQMSFHNIHTIMNRCQILIFGLSEKFSSFNCKKIYEE